MLEFTFASEHRVVPDHVSFLQDAGDGFRAMGPDEAVVAQEGHGAAELQAVPKPLPVHRDAGVGTFVVSER